MNSKSHLYVGIGVSTNKDSYEAGRESAKSAIGYLKGRKPLISYVFYAGDYDPYKLSKGLKEILQDSEFVGGSTPTVFYDDILLHEGVIVISLYSEFLRIGVASSDNVTKNPNSVSKKVTIKALEKINLKGSLNEYLDFWRLKKENIRSVIKIPTFMLMVFTRGFRVKNFGKEVEIISGISEVIGQYAPIFGGSLGVPLEKVFKNIPYDIYTLHSGTVMKDGIVVILVSSGLIYANSIAHGCEPMKYMGLVSGVEMGGHVISTISNKSAVEWYSEALGITKTAFMKNIMEYTQKYPIAMPDGEGGYVMRAGGMPFADEKLMYIAPFKEGTPVVLMSGTDENMLKSAEEIKRDITSHVGRRIIPKFGFGIICASREIVLKDKTRDDLKRLRQVLRLNNAKFAGFYSFGEIGSKPGRLCKFNHLTSNILLFYDNLITDSRLSKMI